MEKATYKWNFGSLGGAVRVKIRNGEDIAHLGELDRKLWTVLSCPVKDLEFDAATLKYLDRDGDGRIHVDEVIATSQWLTDILKNPDILLKEKGELNLSDFNENSVEGAKLLKSSKQILCNLALEKDSISLEDTTDNAKIFANTGFNGDGVITKISAADDATLAELIDTISTVTGGSPDRSGKQGINADQIEAFYTACAEFDAWQESLKAETLPYGESTAAALAAVDCVKAKIADFFMRCKLADFNPAALAAVDVDVEKIKAISTGELSDSNPEIESYPLARPNAEGKLPIASGINPAWQQAFNSLKTLVLDKDYEGKQEITEEDWNAILSKLNPYRAWVSEKKGIAVEGLGSDTVKSILKEDRKKDLLNLTEQDKALEEEALSIEAVNKLLHLCRDFYAFLNNYVSFSDFYSDDKRAVFEAGNLYIDQRRLDLCIKVSDMGKQDGIAGLSGMCIIYCACNSTVTGKTFSIAAVLTNGDANNLRVGKNAIFYDRTGEVYDAVITKIIDNPVSLGQAFWSPYRKFGQWISDKFGKKLSESESKGFGELVKGAEEVKIPAAAPDGSKPAPQAPSNFDIAKFAGIFAAIGMAVAYLSQAFVAIAKGAANLGVWKVALVLIAMMLVISGPSVILAWLKLRKRDLGPLLNANGWAINAASYVRSKFGAGLTKLAKYPMLNTIDPMARKKSRCRKLIWTLVIIVVLATVAFVLNQHILLIRF